MTINKHLAKPLFEQLMEQATDGIQLFCIGIIGEYVGRTFEQSKDRPIYIAKEVLDYEQN